jgi:hypothetical protein
MVRQSGLMSGPMSGLMSGPMSGLMSGPMSGLMSGPMSGLMSGAPVHVDSTWRAVSALALHSIPQLLLCRVLLLAHASDSECQSEYVDLNISIRGMSIFPIAGSRLLPVVALRVAERTAAEQHDFVGDGRCRRRQAPETADAGDGRCRRWQMPAMEDAR